MIHNNISNFKINNIVNGYYILSDANEHFSTNSGYLYLTMILSDKTGSVSAIAFNYPADINESALGSIVYVNGVIELYREKLQLKVKSIHLLNDSNDDEFDLSDLLESSTAPQQMVFDRLKKYIASIDDDDYRRLCETVLDRYKLEIYTFPAGKTQHHCRPGGLATHTLGVIETALSTLNTNPDLDKDLLIAGGFLHDIGKAVEYKMSAYGLFSKKSCTGKLLNHIQAGIQIVTIIAIEQNIPDEKRETLIHIVANHHRNLKFKEGLLAEAIAIAEADNSDAEFDRERNERKRKARSLNPAA